MGNFFARLAARLADFFKRFSATDDFRVLLLGLDNAGKTSILKGVAYKESIGVSPPPTLGMNVEEFSPCPRVNFTVWDLGGRRDTRALWHIYYEGTNGLMYVVDSTDAERIDENAKQLTSVLADERLQGVPVLVLANKQDMPNCISCDELIKRLHLEKLTERGHVWSIQSTSALIGAGLAESMEKMARMIKEQKKGA